MISKVRMLLSLFFFMSVILSGCGLISSQGELESSGETGELSAKEVIQKTQKVMNSLYGYRILTKGEVTQTTKDNSGTKTEQFSIEADQKFNREPLAFHSIQKELNKDGSGTTQEVYLENGVIYMNTGSQWTKVTEPNMVKSFTKNPLDFIDLIVKGNGQGVQMKKDAGAYHLILDESFGKDFLSQNFSNTFQGQAQENIMSNFHIEKFQQEIWIDDATFQIKKMTTDLSFEIPFNGNTIKTESLTQIDFKGEYKQQIVVPSNIKNEAKPFTNPFSR